MPRIGIRRVALLVGFICLTTVLVIHTYRADKASKPWTIANDDKTSIPDDLKNMKLKNPLYFGKPKQHPFTEETLRVTNHSFYALRTTADRVWSHMPLQLSTALKQFPHNKIYSDTAASIGNHSIADILASLDPHSVETLPELATYRVRRYGSDQDWGWAPENYKESHHSELLNLMVTQIVKTIKEDAPHYVEWFILADENSFVSASALAQLVGNADPSEPVIYRWNARGHGPDHLLWSRGALDIVIGQNFGEHTDEIRHVVAGNISSTPVEASRWCGPLVFFDDLKPWEVQTLYDREVSSTPSTTYADYYRDFILPFVKTERQNWQLDPQGSRYTEQFNENIQPHTNKKHCKRLCEMKEGCLAWQWIENTECWLETDLVVRRGAGKNYHFSGWKDGNPLVSSGYLIDRIRQIRNQSACDPLHISNAPQSKANDVEFTAEGWHALLRERVKIEGSDILRALEDYQSSQDIFAVQDADD